MPRHSAEGRPSSWALLFLILSVAIVSRGIFLGGRELAVAESYETQHRLGVFWGLDPQLILQIVNRRLAPDLPIAPGSSLPGDAGFPPESYYRLTDVFYPRRINPSAAHRLELLPRGAAHEGVVLGTLEGERDLVLLGALEPPTPSAPASGPETHFDPPALALALAGIWGLGILFRSVLFRTSGSAAEIALLGVLVLAIAAHTATWFQFPLPWRVFGVLGLVATFAWLIRRLAVGRGSSKVARINPWLTLPLAVLLLALLRGLVVPVTEWDGRFVWLLHGRQLFVHGFLEVSESLTIGLQPTYPLLTPSLFSFAASWSDAFNERTAVFLGVALHAVVAVTIARLAMDLTGRFRGALLSALTATITLRWTTEAYADGLLASLLLLEFLALERGDQRLGWLAAACAALTKREGLLLALILVLARRGRAFKPGLIAVLPALIHVFWCRANGLPHELDALRPILGLPDFAARTALIARKAAGVIARHPPFALAAAGFLSISWTRMRTQMPSPARGALDATLLYCAFIFIVFLVTPQPLVWHLETALPRLALHPVCFALLAIFIFLGRRPEAT